MHPKHCQWSEAGDSAFDATYIPCESQRCIYHSPANILALCTASEYPPGMEGSAAEASAPVPVVLSAFNSALSCRSRAFRAACKW